MDEAAVRVTREDEEVVAVAEEEERRDDHTGPMRC